MLEKLKHDQAHLTSAGDGWSPVTNDGCFTNLGHPHRSEIRGVFLHTNQPTNRDQNTWEPATPTPTSSAVTAADPPNPPATQQERMLHRPAEAEADATYLGRMGKTFSTQIDGNTKMPPWQSRLRCLKPIPNFVTEKK